MVASIDKIGRREFLRAGLVFGAGAAGLAAGYAAVPDVFARAMYAAKQEKVTNDKVLVMIQLAGGNDGLQTVIPLHGPVLPRPAAAAVAVGRRGSAHLDAQFGLNKNLVGTKKLWDDGKLAIVQGVGYPEPSFSHFDSIRVWETADPDAPPAGRLARQDDRDRTTTPRGTRWSAARAARPESPARFVISKPRSPWSTASRASSSTAAPRWRRRWARSTRARRASTARSSTPRSRPRATRSRS